jgi:predicted dienelactone hydrolase
MASMRRAASTGNLRLRLDDVPAVLDQLERWNTEVTHPLQGRLDLNRVGMSGHSFGAMTTQGVSGMTFPFWGNRATDSRIRAALVMSPSTSQAISPEKSFSKVRIPWMVMTGTRDSSIIIRTDPEDRLRVFDSLPLGNKYQLVFKDGEHMAFSEQSLPMDGVKKNPNHHRAILALSTAFWDAYLGQNAEAHGWLDGQGPRSILQTGDQWDRK